MLLKPLLQRLLRALLPVALLITASVASAQGCISEQEPNDTPAQANPVAGAACVTGTLSGTDQDAFAWTLSDEDARRPWRFELEGIRGQLTKLELFEVRFAANGSDVTSAELLMSLGTPDGRVVTGEPRLFAAGTYIVGLSASGGAGPYTVAFVPGAEAWPFEDVGLAGADRGDASAEDAVPAEPEALERKDDFELTGRLLGAQSLNWTITAEMAAQLWKVELHGAVGESPRLRVDHPDGSNLTELTVGEGGVASIAALGVEAGVYRLELTPSATLGAPFRLSAAPQGVRTDGHEVEPNDAFWSANVFEPGRELRGSLSSGGDTDYFRFTLDEQQAARVLNLETGAEGYLEVCLQDADRYTIQCRAGEGARLPALLLPAGDYTISLGRASREVDTPYVLRLEDAGAPTQAFVTEPNDTTAWAFPVPEELAVRGELYGEDVDFLQLDVSGEPQLWRVQARGAGVHELRYHTVGGYGAHADRSGERLRLDNLYLQPGTHFISVRGNGGEYAVRFLPLGPPSGDHPAAAGESAAQAASPSQAESPAAADSPAQDDAAPLPSRPRPEGAMEQEPNDDHSRADLLRFGEPRVGLLANRDDLDVYRFFLADGQHVRLQVIPPEDGEYDAALYWGTAHIARTGNNLGELISTQEWLPAGDYHLVLNARQPSDEYYQVTLERLDPFTVLPERRADYPEWFGRSSEDGVAAETEAVREPAAELPLELELAASADAPLAAYWPYAQATELTLNLTNSSAVPLELELDHHSTDAGFRPQLPARLSLSAGQEMRLSVPLQVMADAYDDEVVLTVRAQSADGSQKTASLSLTPSGHAAPIGSHLAWPLPDELLGGLNAAWSAFGAELVFENHQEEEVARRLGMPWLLDGMTPLDHDYLNYRMWDWMPRDYGIEELPPTVRLAGEEPVEVIGVLLNPLASGELPLSLRDFAVHLSLDGVEFTEVLRGALSPRQVEQAFVLPEPVMARYARLELLGNQIPGAGPQDADFRLGTFKVVTTHDSASAVTGGEGLNLALPDLGGHVVWSDPGSVAHYGDSMLRAGDGRYPQGRMGLEQEQAEWVIAFLNNRAAQVSELQWLDHPDSEEDGYYKLFKRVELSVSTESPAGPWRDIGTWNLERGSGSVAPFVLPEPIWARYVRLRAVGLTPREHYDWPDAIRVIERTPDEEYRSALGEWGHYSAAGPYEHARGAAPVEARVAAGNDERASALRLEPGDIVRGAVELGVNEAWYRVDVPEGQNHLQVTLTGEPNRGFAQELTDTAGEAVEVSEEAGPVTTVLSAAVQPGDYWLRVFEPPRSVVITWDTSGSVSAALPVIYQALTNFALSVSPGVEEVNLMPFDSPFLMLNWSSDPLRVLQAVNDDPRSTSSSSGEAALLAASRALADRPGKKAVILLTDGAVPREAELWPALLEVRPQVFASEITAAGDLGPNARYEQKLMQDYGSVNAGYYEYVRAQGDFDVSFRRAAAWLRRPSRYLVSVETDQRWAKASPWAEPELERAREQGLIPASLASADLTRPVTRAEFAAVAVRVFEALSGTKAVPALVNPFTDTNDMEVLKAFNTELAVGVSATEFAPDALLNREQAATILTRVFKKVNLPGWTWAADAEFQLEFDEPQPFTDDELISNWAKESVYFMAANGIIAGTGAGKFAPRATTPEEAALGYANATREQALLLAVRLVGME